MVLAQSLFGKLSIYLPELPLLSWLRLLFFLLPHLCLGRTFNSMYRRHTFFLSRWQPGNSYRQSSRGPLRPGHPQGRGRSLPPTSPAQPRGC